MKFLGIFGTLTEVGWVYIPKDSESLSNHLFISIKTHMYVFTQRKVGVLSGQRDKRLGTHT